VAEAAVSYLNANKWGDEPSELDVKEFSRPRLSVIKDKKQADQEIKTEFAGPPLYLVSETNAQPNFEDSQPRYIERQLGRFALAATAYRLEHDLTKAPNGEYLFDPAAEAYGRADSKTRLLEAVASRHRFNMRQVFEPGEGLKAFGVSVLERAERWRYSSDVAGIPVAEERAEAEIHEARLLNSIAQEIYLSGELPGFKIATISTYPHELDDEEAKKLHYRPDVKLAKIRTFSFTIEQTETGQNQIVANLEELMIENSHLDLFSKLAKNHGATVSRQASSADLLATQIPVSTSLSAVELGRQYDALLSDKFPGHEFMFGKDVTKLTSDLNWEQTDELAEPFVVADLEFAKQIAISRVEQKSTQAINNFANNLLTSGNLNDAGKAILLGKKHGQGFSVDEQLAEFLTDKYLIKIMSELACVLGTEAAYKFFGHDGVEEVRQIVTARLNGGFMGREERIINIIGNSSAEFFFCGGGVGKKDEEGSLFNQSSKQAGESLFGGGESMKCVTCPFCKKTVDAIVTKDEIECPSCHKVVSKQTGKVNK
jgi:hypothetical protein